MLCEKFESLNTVDKVIFIGQLCHAVQSDDELFDFAQQVINLGIVKGLFDRVKILPTQIHQDVKE